MVTFRKKELELQLTVGNNGTGTIAASWGLHTFMQEKQE